MSLLQCLLGIGKNLLQLWKKYEVYAKSNGVRPEQPWRHLNPWTRDQEKQKPWSQARCFWKTKDVLPFEANAQESPTGKTRRPSYNTLKVVRRWRIQEVTIWHRMERTPHNYCTIGSPWRRTSTKLRERKEFRLRIVSWILTANSEGGTQLPLNQRPNFAQAKREWKRLHDEHLARTQQEYKDIPRSQQIRQRKGQQFEGHEELDYAVDPITGWRFYRQSRGNLQTSASGSQANLEAASSSSSTWDPTQRKTSKYSQVLTSGEFMFSWLGQVSVAWRNLQPTDGVCEQYTHKDSTHRVAHSTITYHHANTRGSR